MPNLAAPHRFHDKMLGVEQDFAKDALKLYAAFRRDALDIVDSLGLDSPQLVSGIRARLNLLAADIRGLAIEYVKPLEQTATGYASDALDALRAVEPKIPAFDQLQPDRQSIVSDFLASAANFVDVISGRFIVALDEARQSMDDPQAVSRIFAPDLVDGRASPYRHGENTIKYESQRRLWTVGVALAGAYFLSAKEQSGVKLQKQAVAVIDDKTTPCCLDIHGQIKDIDEPFEFGSEPCGSGRKQHPPFPGHQCRTVEAPYLPKLERLGITTAEMKTQALAERANR